MNAENNKHFNHLQKVLLLAWYKHQNSNFPNIKSCAVWGWTRSVQNQTLSQAYLHFLSFHQSHRWRNRPIPCNKSVSGHGRWPDTQSRSAFLHESLNFKWTVILCMPFLTTLQNNPLAKRNICFIGMPRLPGSAPTAVSQRLRGKGKFDVLVNLLNYFPAGC